MKKVLLLLSLFAFAINADAQRRSKTKKVPGKIVTVLTRHPDEITLKGSDTVNNVLYYFFVTDQGLFFTDNEELFEEIQEHLPAKQIAGNSVELEGTKFRPFTKFPRVQLDRLSRRAGKVINKKTDAVRISGHLLLAGGATVATSGTKTKVETVDKNGQPVKEH